MTIRDFTVIWFPKPTFLEWEKAYEWEELEPLPESDHATKPEGPVKWIKQNVLFVSWSKWSVWVFPHFLRFLTPRFKYRLCFDLTGNGRVFNFYQIRREP